MLRCARCGRAVSEWAARCPDCGHGTDDAEMVAGTASPRPPTAGTGVTTTIPGRVTPGHPTTVAAGPPAGSAPLPSGDRPPDSYPGADDADPDGTGEDDATLTPSRPLRRRPVAVGLAVVVLAVVGTGVTLGVRAGGHGTTDVPTGVVLSELVARTPQGGTLVLGPPTGSVTAEVPSTDGAGTGLLAAPDGPDLATGTGREFSLEHDRLVATGRDVPFVGPPGSWSALGFTDHDGGLVASEQTEGDENRFEAVAFDGHRTVSFGRALSAVGDPADLGVFAVTDGETSDPGPVALGDQGGVVVERLDAGARPTVLATAAQIDTDLGQSAEDTGTISLLADPTGTRLAVLVVSDGPGSGAGGIVVLSRTGDVLGAVRVAGDGVGTPAWSPDGSSLVYGAATSGRPAVTLWRIGAAPTTRSAPASPLPIGDNVIDRCLWSITGDGYLCASAESVDNRAEWLVARPGGPLISEEGPPMPLAWLAAGTASG